MATAKWKKDNRDKMCEYRTKWYRKNKKKQLKQQKKYRPTRRKTIKDWMSDYKSTLTCDRCPENHPATFDFHHLDTSKKEINISEAIRHGWSIERIQKEIDKCIILCANCHRKLHYEEQMSG